MEILGNTHYVRLYKISFLTILINILKDYRKLKMRIDLNCHFNSSLRLTPLHNQCVYGKDDFPFV